MDSDETQQYGNTIESQKPVQSLPLGMSDPNFAQWMLDPSERIAYLEHRLRNEIFDFMQKKWVKKGKPLMNEHGISDIISLVAEFFERNAVLSNMDMVRISRICTDLNMGLNNLIFLHHSDYKLDKWKFDLVVHIVIYPIYFALKRSQEGMTLDALTKTIMIRETTGQTPRQKTGGLFAGLFGGRK